MFSKFQLWNKQFNYFKSSVKGYTPYINYTWSTLPVGNEYVTDGVELIDSNNWVYDAMFSVTENVATVISSSAGSIYQYPATIAGVKYLYKIKVDNFQAGQAIHIKYNNTTILAVASDGEFEIEVDGVSNGQYRVYVNGAVGVVFSNMSIQKVIREPNNVYLKDSGTSKSNALMYSGRALAFNGVDQKIIVNDKLTAKGLITTNGYTILFNKDVVLDARALLWFGATDITVFGNRVSIYSGVVSNLTLTKSKATIAIVVDTENVKTHIYEDGVLLTTFNVVPNYLNQLTEIGTRSAYNSFAQGQLSNLIIHNEAITPTQAQAYHQDPVGFLYKDEAGSLQSDYGLDTSKVVSWFPMCETDGYVRDMVGYSEVYRSNFTTGLDGWISSNATLTYADNKITVVNSLATAGSAKQTFETVIGKTYYFIFKFHKLSSSTASQTRLSVSSTSYGYTGDLVATSSLSTDGQYYYHSFTATTTSTFVSLYENSSNAGDGFTVSDIKLVESGIYPITNYLSTMNKSQLTTGLQTMNIKRDALGVYQYRSNFLEGDGNSYADTGWIPDFNTPIQIETVFYNGAPSMSCVGGTSSKDLHIGTRYNSTANVRCFSNETGYGSSALLINTYMHVVLTYNGDGTFYVTVNGVNSATDTCSNVSSRSSLFIARESNIDRYTNKYPIRKVTLHIEAQDPLELYNKAVAKGLLT